MTRREWMKISAATAAVARPVFAIPAPASPVAVSRCRTYERAELVPTMEKLFDQLGGMQKLVAGKTVVMKVNLTGGANLRLGHLPAEKAHWTHPAVIATTVHLLNKAGAKRIRIVESAWNTAEPLEQTMYEANWDPTYITKAGGVVELRNTNYIGTAKQYSKFTPPNGGHMFKEYYLNHNYEECDVFVSIAKMKEHATTGFTMSMKNCFGITPCTIYGDGAPKQEPGVLPKGGRGSVMHSGARPPAKIAPAENPCVPKDGGGRVPRVVADLVAARPIHLAIVEGVDSMAAGEGPWIPGVVGISPGLIFAGLNPVCTDAVGLALMGYDPMSDRGTAPFQKADNMLALAETHGVGTRDLSRIEVIGLPVKEGIFEFKNHRAPKSEFVRRG